MNSRPIDYVSSNKQPALSHKCKKSPTYYVQARRDNLVKQGFLCQIIACIDYLVAITFGELQVRYVGDYSEHSVRSIQVVYLTILIWLVVYTKKNTPGKACSFFIYEMRFRI